MHTAIHRTSPRSPDSWGSIPNAHHHPMLYTPCRIFYTPHTISLDMQCCDYVLASNFWVAEFHAAKFGFKLRNWANSAADVLASSTLNFQCSHSAAVHIFSSLSISSFSNPQCGRRRSSKVGEQRWELQPICCLRQLAPFGPRASHSPQGALRFYFLTKSRPWVLSGFQSLQEVQW